MIALHCKYWHYGTIFKYLYLYKAEIAKKSQFPTFYFATIFAINKWFPKYHTNPLASEQVRDNSTKKLNTFLLLLCMIV